ncbi:MAG TPA: histidinol-phosphate transaminase [Verrucomicrobiae bacterium]|nr:histidinol-phosphate transaminase [Verrucomicrobiae bacterium]
MLPINPNLAQLPVYQPGRPIEEVARELGLPAADVIKLASNENPLGPSPAALAAMERTLHSLHLYPDGNAYYLKRRLAEKLALDPSQLILGNGSNEIIEFVGHALIAPETEVVVSEYCFAVYPIVTHLFGGKLVTMPAREFGHDLQGMLGAVTPRTRVIFVANPNNPTGTLIRAEELRAFVSQVPSQVLLVVDEAYIEFLSEPCDLLPLIRRGQAPNVLLMRTFSKIYGLAGLRLGYGIGHPDLIAALEKVRQPFNINALIQAGALAALDDSEHIERTRRNNAEGLELFESSFRELNLRFVPSAANFILVQVGDGPGVCMELQKLGVIVRPMAGYRLPEWIRISVGTPAENARCLQALRKVLGSANSQ